MSVRSSSEWVAAFHMFVSADVLRRADDSFLRKIRMLRFVSVVSVGPEEEPLRHYHRPPSKGPYFRGFRAPKRAPTFTFKGPLLEPHTQSHSRGFPGR